MNRAILNWASFTIFSAITAVASSQSASREELGQWWADLAGTDGMKAYRAMGQLASRSEIAVPFLAERMQPVAGVAPGRIPDLITDLDSDKFAVRDKAQQELEQLESQAQPSLVKALAVAPNLEVRLRIERLLDKLDLLKSPDRLQAMRAIEVLENIGSSDAKQLLQKLAHGAPDALQTREAKASLARLAAKKIRKR